MGKAKKQYRSLEFQTFYLKFYPWAGCHFAEIMMLSEDFRA